jgi:cell division protein FtsB
MKPKQAKRKTPARDSDESRRSSRNTTRRPAEAPPRRRKPAREQRPQRSAPATNPIPRPTDGPARPKNASQAKARAKARKAKAPKVVRPPLRERIVVKLSSIELSPRALVARVPFVVLVIGSLGVGLGVTLWLSTDAAERSYQLSHARETNQALLQQKEALERQVLEAQAAPALAEAARDLGMIPSRDTAHLVQDASGNWVVVGTPKPAQGIAPPPLNTPLPEEGPPTPPPPPAPRVVEPREVTVRVPPRAPVAPAPLPGVERSMPVTGAVPLAAPPGAEVPHAATGQAPSLGPAVAPAPPAEVPAAPVVADPLPAAPA